MSKNKINTSKTPGSGEVPSPFAQGRRPNPWDIGFMQILSITTVLRLVFAFFANLKYEEAYYWCYSQHPAWGYYDHPPMVAWIIRLFTSIGADQECWVRMGAVLLFMGTMLCLHRLTKSMFGSRTAFFTVLASMCLPAFEWYSILMVPDAPLLFFWSLGLYFSWFLVKNERPPLWWGVGLACGLGMLSKYVACFIMLTPMVYLIVTRRTRLLNNLHFYGSVLLSLLLFSPVIYWNSQNEWVSFLFQGVSQLAPRSSILERLGGSLLTQTIILGPGCLIAMVWAGIKSWKLARYEKDQRHLFLLCSCLPFSLLLVAVMFSRQIPLNWPVPVYVGGIICLIAHCSNLKMWNGRKGILALIFLPALIIAISPWLGTFWKTSLFNKANEFVGWNRLGYEVQQAKATMLRPGETFVAGNGHQVASEIAFYSKDPNVLSSNILGQKQLSYDYWCNPNDLLGQDCLYVVYEEQNSEGKWYSRVKFDKEDLEKHFLKVEMADRLTVYNGGKPLRLYRFFKCYTYLGPDAALAVQAKKKYQEMMEKEWDKSQAQRRQHPDQPQPGDIPLTVTLPSSDQPQGSSPLN